MLCFSVCLIGCAVPALAIDGYVSGAATGIYFSKSSGANVYPLSDGNQSLVAQIVNSKNQWLLDLKSTNTYTGYVRLNYDPASYIEIQFNSPGTLTVNSSTASFYYGAYDVDGVQIFSNGFSASLVVDGVIKETESSTQGSNGNRTFTTATYEVTSGFAWRYTPNSDAWRTLQSGDTYKGLLLAELPFTFTASGPGTQQVINEIKIVQGQLTDIKDDTGEIVQNTETIIAVMENVATDVSHIDLTLTDMKQQLESPSSNIWQAAGQTIKDAVTSLFVPSQQEIQDVKQQFDQLAQDKLGGAYTAMETVDNTVTQVNNKLNNPSAQQGINFPGIAVPLGGDVGTVTIAQPQVVTLPTQLTAILHPVASIIIPIICGLGTFNTMKDIVECFLSGYSYSEYLHRDKGGGDE